MTDDKPKPMLADYGYDPKVCEIAEAILKAEHEGLDEPEDVLMRALESARRDAERAVWQRVERIIGKHTSETFREALISMSSDYRYADNLKLAVRDILKAAREAVAMLEALPEPPPGNA
jgi:hypothetical protein